MPQLFPLFVLACPQIPTELVERMWRAKRLPVLVDEAVRAVNGSMATLEARFLQGMREEQAGFAAEIAAATERTMVRPWVQGGQRVSFGVMCVCVCV